MLGSATSPEALLVVVRAVLESAACPGVSLVPRSFAVVLLAFMAVLALYGGYMALRPQSERNTQPLAGALFAWVGAVFAALARSFPPPANLALGLAAFQVFFIPTGIMYWKASRTAPADIAEVHRLLRARAGEEAATPSA